MFVHCACKGIHEYIEVHNIWRKIRAYILKAWKYVLVTDPKKRRVLGTVDIQKERLCSDIMRCTYQTSLKKHKGFFQCGSQLTSCWFHKPQMMRWFLIAGFFFSRADAVSYLPSYSSLFKIARAKKKKKANGGLWAEVETSNSIILKTV